LTESFSHFGFLNAFKPPGMTSTAFGGWVKRLLGKTPVGHWGTLDPAACGVLVLAVGHATRLLPLISPSHKQYVFDLKLGSSTDTADESGRVLETGPLPADWSDRLESVVAGLVGPLDQVPPMFSAVKVDGRALYVSARRGQHVARAARPTMVHALRVLSKSERGARLLVESEAGLYVRSLCEEIGRRLGVLAHMGALVRTAAGPFSIGAAWLPEDIAKAPAACLLDPLSVLRGPRIELDEAAARRFQNGNPVPTQNVHVAPERSSGVSPERSSGALALVLHGNRLIGFGSVDAGGALSPHRVFP
jgi:tRNA pseudouridine55 synthase